MATKKNIHVDGVCNFSVPIEHVQDAAENSIKVAAHAIALAELVTVYPSLTFSVNAEGIEATIDSCQLVNNIGLEALVREILATGERKYKAYCQRRQRDEKPKAKAKKAA